MDAFVVQLTVVLKGKMAEPPVHSENCRNTTSQSPALWPGCPPSASQGLTQKKVSYAFKAASCLQSRLLESDSWNRYLTPTLSSEQV